MLVINRAYILEFLFFVMSLQAREAVCALIIDDIIKKGCGNTITTKTLCGIDKYF